MKTPSNDLFELIHSLTASEKRYFTLFISKSGGGQETQYLRLFEILLEQERYDELVAADLLISEGIQQKITDLKSYLYKTLLKSLRAYHEEKKVRYRIRNLIMEAEILLEKTLYDQAYQILSRAKKLSQKSGDPVLALEIHLLENRLVKRPLKKNKLPDLAERNAERNALKEVIQHHLEGLEVYDLAFHLSGLSRTGEDIKQELRRLKDAFSAAEKRRVTEFYAEHLWLQARAITHYVEGEYEAMYRGYMHLVNHWEAHPAQMNEQMSRFRTLLSNLLGAAVLSGKTNEIPKWLEKIRQIPAQNPFDDLQAKHTLHIYELSLLQETGELRRARDLGEELSDWLEGNQDRIPRRRLRTFYFNFFAVNLLLDQYSPARKWLEKLQKGTKFEEDRFPFIAGLVVQFSLKNHEILPSLYRSIRRKVTWGESYAPAFLQLLNLFRDLLNVPDEGEAKLVFRDYWKGWQNEIKGEESEPATLILGIWLQSRATGKSMEDIYLNSIPGKSR